MTDPSKDQSALQAQSAPGEYAGLIERLRHKTWFVKTHGGHWVPAATDDKDCLEAATAITALAARVEELEKERNPPEPLLTGTFACPLCGKEQPHHHTQAEIDSHTPGGALASAEDITDYDDY